MLPSVDRSINRSEVAKARVRLRCATLPAARAGVVCAGARAAVALDGLAPMRWEADADKLFVAKNR